MAKQIPTDRESVNTINYRTRFPIRASDWKALAHAAHHDFAHAGARFGGQVFDPAFETTATSYTQTPDNVARPLNTITPIGKLERLVDDGGGDASLEIMVKVWGANVDFRARLYNEDTGSLIATLNPVNTSATHGVAEDSAIISLSDTEMAAGGKPAMLYLVEDVQQDSTGGGELLWVSPYEFVITDTSRLPTTPFTP